MLEVFKILFAKTLTAHHRLADSGAAGTLIAQQPSDYLLGLPDGCINLTNGQRLCFFEVKASEAKHSMPKDAVRPAQRGAIGRFRAILGLPYFILFWDAQLGVIQLWDGMAIHDNDRIDKAYLLATWSDVGVINRLRHEVVAAKIIDYFQIPSSTSTLNKAR